MTHNLYLPSYKTKSMKFLICLLVCIPLFSFSQMKIEVKEKKVTLLIFKSPIEDEFFASREYKRTNSMEKNRNQYILPITYVKVKGVETNSSLTVITADGQIHEFDLHYSKNPKQFNYKIASKTPQVASNDANEIKDVVPLVSDYSKGVETIEYSTEIKQEYSDDDMEAYCQRTLNVKQKIRQATVKKSNVILTLKELSYDSNVLFFHFSLTNKGVQDFEIEKTFFVMNSIGGNSGKSNVELVPLYVFEKPDRITGNTKVHFIIAFEKFSLDDNKELLMSIAEKEGDNDLLLAINNYIINHPVKLK